MKSYFERTLFTGKGEAFNLMLPVFFLALVILELAFKINFLDNYSRFQISLLANIILLNITHNAFTLILLTSTLPLKYWVDHHGGPKKFWTNQAIIIIALTVFFTQLIYFSTQNENALLLFSWIGFIFAAHHAISQTFGLSLIYSVHLKGAEALSAQKNERLIFNIYLFLNLFGGTLFILHQFKLLVLPMTAVNIGRYVIFGTIFLAGLFLVIQPYYVFKKNGVAKSVFNLRYLLWPLTPFSTVAVFATLVVHGVEYGQVIDKMIKKDSLRRPYLAGFLIFIVIVFAFFRIDGMGSLRKNNGVALWLFLATGFSFAISFHHYYLDRKLFKMRRPLNREYVGALLFDESKPVETKNAE